MMAAQKILSLLLVLLLAVLGLGLGQPSYGHHHMYQRFLQQHVDYPGTNVTDSYCDYMMYRRGMTTPSCKVLNTFIHADIENIINMCNTTNIQCKNDLMNCHEGVEDVTYCRLTGGTSPYCHYQTTRSTRQIVIACDGDPLVPVHFEGTL